jgi:hypothetical protein
MNVQNAQRGGGQSHGAADAGPAWFKSRSVKDALVMSTTFWAML